MGLFGFHFIKLDKLSKEDKKKFEQETLDMMKNFKYTPLKLGNMIPNERYNRVDGKLNFSLTTKRQIREGMLAQVMPKLKKNFFLKAMEQFNDIFIPKRRDFLILKNKVENGLEKEKIM